MVLFQYLERLYNQWEERVSDANETGLFGTDDTRLPIACISAERLAFFVCKTESFEKREPKLKSRISGKNSSQNSDVAKSRAKNKATVVKSSKGTELRSSACSSKEDVPAEQGKKDEAASPSDSKCVVGSSKPRKRRDASSCGCKSLRPLTQAIFRFLLCCRSQERRFQVHRSRKFHVEESDKHYADLGRHGLKLAEITIKKFNRAYATLVVAPIVVDSFQWNNDESIVGEKLRLAMDSKQLQHSLFEVRVTTGSLNSKTCKRNVYVDIPSAQMYVLEPCDIRPSTIMDIHTVAAKNNKARRPRNSTCSGGSGVDGGGRMPTLKATGPIRLIVDLLDLQQIQENCVDQKTVTLCFDDRVGRSFKFTLCSASLRKAFVDSLVESCAQLNGESLPPKIYSNAGMGKRETNISLLSSDEFAKDRLRGDRRNASLSTGRGSSKRSTMRVQSTSSSKRNTMQVQSKSSSKRTTMRVQAVKNMTRFSKLSGTISGREESRARQRRSTRKQRRSTARHEDGDFL